MKSYIENISQINIPILFIVGQSSVENQELITESESDDLWFHLSNYPSAHIVAKINDMTLTKKQMKNIIKRGACLSKNISKHSSETLEITYTHIKHLELTDIVGTVNVLRFKTIII